MSFDQEKTGSPVLRGDRSESKQQVRLGRISCKGCWLGHACVQHGMDEIDLAWLHLNSVKRHVPHGAAVYRTGDVFHSIFALRSGTCKSVAVCSDGHEKIIAFHLPGEMFGLTAITPGKYTYDVIAVDDSEVCAVPYSQLLTLSLKDPRLQQALFKVFSSAIGRHQGFLERLEPLPAKARVVAWLLNLSERYGRCGYSPDQFPLAGTRIDAGSYLGLAHETVTRVLTRLSKAGIILLTEKNIQIKDRNLLMAEARNYLPA